MVLNITVKHLPNVIVEYKFDNLKTDNLNKLMKDVPHIPVLVLSYFMLIIANNQDEENDKNKIKLNNDTAGYCLDAMRYMLTKLDEEEKELRKENPYTRHKHYDYRETLAQYIFSSFMLAPIFFKNNTVPFNEYYETNKYSIELVNIIEPLKYIFRDGFLGHLHHAHRNRTNDSGDGKYVPSTYVAEKKMIDELTPLMDDVLAGACVKTAGNAYHDQDDNTSASSSLSDSEYLQHSDDFDEYSSDSDGQSLALMSNSNSNDLFADDDAYSSDSESSISSSSSESSISSNSSESSISSSGSESSISSSRSDSSISSSSSESSISSSSSESSISSSSSESSTSSNNYDGTDDDYLKNSDYKNAHDSDDEESLNSDAEESGDSDSDSTESDVESESESTHGSGTTQDGVNHNDRHAHVTTNSKLGSNNDEDHNDSAESSDNDSVVSDGGTEPDSDVESKQADGIGGSISEGDADQEEESAQEEEDSDQEEEESDREEEESDNDDVQLDSAKITPDDTIERLIEGANDGQDLDSDDDDYKSQASSVELSNVSGDTLEGKVNRAIAVFSEQNYNDEDNK